MAKNYIPHDSNARNSKKMLRMREALGPIEGPAVYGIYWMLVERLRDEEGYTSDLDYKMLLFDLRCDEELLRKAVEMFGLFDVSEDGKTFNSHGLLERMRVVELRSAAGKKGASAKWDVSMIHQQNADGKSDGKTDSKSDGKHDGTNKIKEQKVQNTFCFSYYLKKKADAIASSKEKEKKVILYYFTFVRNFKSPAGELERMLDWNVLAKKGSWDDRTMDEKDAILNRWKPADKDGLNRFPKKLLPLWQAFFDKVIETYPDDERLWDDMLNENVSFSKTGSTIYFRCTRYAIDRINNDGKMGPYIKEMKDIRDAFHCTTFVYRIINEEE